MPIFKKTSKNTSKDKDLLDLKLLIDYIPINKYVLTGLFVILIFIGNLIYYGFHPWVYSGYLLEIFLAFSTCYGTDYAKRKWLKIFINELNMPLKTKQEISQNALNNKVRIFFLILISSGFFIFLVIFNLHPYYNSSKSLVLLILFTILIIGIFAPIASDGITILLMLIYLIIKNRDKFQFNSYSDDKMGGTKKNVELYIKNCYVFILIILAVFTYIWLIALNSPKTISQYSITLDSILIFLFTSVSIFLIITLFTYPSINSLSLIKFKNKELHNLNLKISQYYQEYSNFMMDYENSSKRIELSSNLFKKILQLEVLRNQRIYILKLRVFLIDSSIMLKIFISIVGILISYFLNLMLRMVFL